jgi:hypothetical protein
MQGRVRDANSIEEKFRQRYGRPLRNSLRDIEVSLNAVRWLRTHFESARKQHPNEQVPTSKLKDIYRSGLFLALSGTFLQAISYRIQDGPPKYLAPTGPMVIRFKKYESPQGPRVGLDLMMWSERRKKWSQTTAWSNIVPVN